MHQKTRAIVLNHIKYGDSGIIVKVVTEDFGRQSVIVHGVRKRKARFNFALFEPFSLINLDLYYKQNQALHLVKDAKHDASFQYLYNDVYKNCIAIFLCEILDKSLQEVECNRLLFEFIYHSVQVLFSTNKSLNNFHLFFLVQLTKFLGIYPENNNELSNYPCSGEIQLDDLFRKSFTEFDQIQLKNKTRTELLNQIINYFRNHLDGIGEIKSLPVLYSLFH